MTGTQEVVDKAGREREMAYQLAKKSKEIKRDLETILLANQGYVVGNSTTARKLRSMGSFIATNDSRATDGADATAATAAATDGTNRTFTETILKAVLQTAYANGAEPSILMVGPVNKQRVSDFTGRSSAREVVAADRIQAAASLYASDYGNLKVVPNRFQRERDAWLIDPEYAAVAWLRPFHTFDLAKIGDADRKVIIGECTLQMRNEAAHAVAADLTTT